MLLALAASPALAWTYVGSPAVSTNINRPAHDLTTGTAVVTKIRMHACAGGYTDYPVNQSVDPVAGFTKTIGAGNWCGIQVFWGSSVVVSKPSGTVAYDEPSTSLEIPNGDPLSIAMTPYDLVSGAWSGAAPRLYVTIQ